MVIYNGWSEPYLSSVKFSSWYFPYNNRYTSSSLYPYGLEQVEFVACSDAIVCDLCNSFCGQNCYYFYRKFPQLHATCREFLDKNVGSPGKTSILWAWLRTVEHVHTFEDHPDGVKELLERIIHLFYPLPAIEIDPFEPSNPFETHNILPGSSYVDNFYVKLSRESCMDEESLNPVTFITSDSFADYACLVNDSYGKDS